MKFPFGKAGVAASVALIGAVVYWRVQQSRREADREWEEELGFAIDEGAAAGRLTREDDPGNDS